MSVHQTLKKSIQSVPTKLLHPLCNAELNSTHVYDQIWTLHRLLNAPHSNWVMICSDHSYAVDFLESVAKLSPTRLIFDLLADTQNLSQLTEKILREYLEILKNKTNSLVIVFTQTEAANGNFLDHFLRNFKTLCNLAPEFESILIDTFISQLSVSIKYKYLKAKSSSELDRNLILDEAKKTISKKIRICVLLTDHFSYESFIKTNPNSFSLWPKFFLDSWNQSTCLTLSQHTLHNENALIPSCELKAKLIHNLYSELKEEYHKIFFSQRGLLMLSKLSAQQPNESTNKLLQKSDSNNVLSFWNALSLEDSGEHNPFICFRDRLNHSLPVEDSYFSNEKFIILHKVYARLHDKVEKSLKQGLDEVNSTLKQFQDVWNQYQRTTNQKNKGLVRDTEIQLKIHDLTKAIEEKEQTINSKKVGIYSKQKEITQYEFQVERVKHNLSTFGGQISEFMQRMIKKLEKVPESQFELFVQEINLKDKKSRLYPIVEILCASFLGKLQIFAEFDPEAQKSLLTLISSKYEFLRLIGKHLNVSHETFGLLDYKSTNKLERHITKLSELKDRDQTAFTKILIEWCNFYYKETLSLQEMRLLQEKMEVKKFEMQNCFEFLQTFNESIKNLESEIEDTKKKIDQLTEEHRSLKVNLEKSELGQSRIELLINSLKVVENKYQNKKVKYQKMLESLSYDLIIIAMDIVLLGNLSTIHKFEVISRLLSKNEFNSSQSSVKFSKDWCFDDLFLEKSYKRILKVLGADNLLNAVWCSKFVNSYSRLNLYEYLLNQYLFWGFHETSKPGLFTPCLYSNLGCDLTTLSELVLTEKEDTQLVTLTINYHYQQPFEVDPENTLAITALKKIDKRATNEKLAAELKEYNNFLSTHVLCNLNNKNTDEDWIDLKLVLMKVFKQGDIDKAQEYQDLYIASKAKLALSQQKIDKLLSRPEKNFSQKSVFDAYETELRAYEEIQDFSKELFSMRENLLHEYPIMSTYCNILCLLYHSLFQFGNLAGISVYSWFQYVRVCEAISRKILRDITNKQKAQSKNAPSNNGNNNGNNREESKSSPQKSPRVTAISKAGQGKKNKEILVANEVGEDRSKVSIKTAEGEDNSFYPAIQKPKERDALARANKNQSGKVSEDMARLKNHKSKEEVKDDSLDVEITIDEHFFFSYLVPSIWSVITSSINHELVPLFTLVFAFNVGLKKGVLNENEFALFMKYFTEIPNYKRWKSDVFLNEEETSILSKATLERLETAVKEFVGNDFQELFKVLKEKQKEVGAKDLSLNKFLHQALRDELKEANLIQKLLLSLFANKSDVKSRLLQFIHQELPSIFDYQEEALRIHSFIKTATWHIPVAIFSAPSINTINTFCSIGSYYEVELEVVQLNSDIGEEERTTALTKIQSAALTGSWIVIHSKHLIDFWRDVVLVLQTLREENKIVNSFRLIFDFQELTEKDIDPQFLYEECVIYYLNEHNMEDMEGYNDVWANILNQNIIDFNDKSVFQMEMTQGMNNSLNPSKLVDNLISFEHSKEFGLDDDAKSIATEQNPMMILDEFDYKYMPEVQGMSRIQSNLSIGLGREDSQMIDQLFRGPTDSAKKEK